MTAEGLQTLVAGAFDDVITEIRSAIADLEKVSADAAKLLRPLVSELAAARLVNRRSDPDVAASLAEPARKPGHLQDTAPRLLEAARKLGSAREFM